MQEIIGAKPVGDASFIALKAFGAMHSFGIGGSSVQFRVGSPIWHASAFTAVEPVSGKFHTPAKPRAAPGTATTYCLLAAACGFHL